MRQRWEETESDEEDRETYGEDIRVFNLWDYGPEFSKEDPPGIIETEFVRPGETPPMTEEQILEEMREIEGQMSPENLFMDGERSQAEAQAAAKPLARRRDELTLMLGREPTSADLYPR